MKIFRTFNLATEFYHCSHQLKLTGPLRNQLERASSSIALNLTEGRGRMTIKDQLRFFHIAMGSTRECQAILILSENQQSAAGQNLDQLAASLYRLIARAQ